MKTKKVILDTRAGGSLRAYIPSDCIIDGEWPGILTFRGRGFYCIGTKEKGNVGHYQECRTHQVQAVTTER